MEKEPCAKFCGNFTSFHEVMKLERFEIDKGGITPANV